MLTLRNTRGVKGCDTGPASPLLGSSPRAVVQPQEVYEVLRADEEAVHKGQVGISRNSNSTMHSHRMDLTVCRIAGVGNLARTKDNSRRPFLFPIETINREIDVRLFLAVMLASTERRIIVGKSDSLHALLPHLHDGIYVGKDIFESRFPTDISRYLTMKRQGFSLIHLHEEGAVYRGAEPEWRNALNSILDISVLQSDDVACAWGDYQGDHYRQQRPPGGARVAVTGHPRFDIYKPDLRAYLKEDIERIRREFGSYILVNTNFSISNHWLGIERTMSSGAAIDRRAAWVHSTRVLTSFVSLVEGMARALPSTMIVVRPHPSENLNFYSTMFGGLERVRVLHKGPAAPWIGGASVVIHDGCTTGIEAYFSDVPVIPFVPVRDDKRDYFLPNALGHICYSQDEVLDVVKRIVIEGRFSTGISHIPSRALALLKNFESSSFDLLIDTIHAAEDRLGTVSKSPSLSDLARVHRRYRSRERGRRALGMLWNSRRRRYSYYRSKFYGMGQRDVSERISRISRILGKNVVVSRLSKDVLVVE